MSKLTETAELSSFAAAGPLQSACQRAEASSTEAGTAEASMPPAMPVPKLSVTLPSGKTVTAVGLWMGVTVFLTAIAVQLPILGAWLYSEATDDPPQTGTRRGVDSIIGCWAFISMSMSGYRPLVVGVEYAGTARMHPPPIPHTCAEAQRHHRQKSTGGRMRVRSQPRFLPGHPDADRLRAAPAEVRVEGVHP